MGEEAISGEGTEVARVNIVLNWFEELKARVSN